MEYNQNIWNQKKIRNKREIFKELYLCIATARTQQKDNVLCFALACTNRAYFLEKTVYDKL